MRWRMATGWWWPLGGLLLVAACSRGGPAPQSTDGGASLRQRSIQELPAVGDYAPPVDDGRLLAAGPEGWSLLPRGRSYLIGFCKGKPAELPRIVINAEDPPEGSPEQLDADNAAAFAQRRRAQLQDEVQAGRKQVEEYPLPLQLGPTVYVRHVRRASLSGVPCVVQALETIQHGRLYRVELIAAIEAARSEEYDASLLKWRDLGYAVAAHLQFAAPGERFEPLTSGETGPPATAPADTPTAPGQVPETKGQKDPSAGQAAKGP